VSPAGGYEAIIGLEVHIQLRTRSKIFCGCDTGFGAPPNTHVCPVCLGHPGTLPVANREAVALALRFGLAVEGEIASHSRFARKNYFYPDLPKGYQISQYEAPLIAGGTVPFRVRGAERRVRLVRAHLEEDAGKSLHPESGKEAASWIDLNRAGVPLLEVVSEPDLRTSEEAHAFMERVRQLVVYLGISDGNMEAGSLRADANVSVRPAGQAALNPKTEIKNLNSFRHVERALEWEIARQCRVLDEGGRLEQATRAWDPGEGRTRVLRGKEEAEDYRYFPDPDLRPIPVAPSWVESVAAALPELPWAKEDRLVATYGIALDEAILLSGSPELADYFEAAARAAGDGKSAAHWIATQVLRLLKESPDGWSGVRVSPQALGRMIRMIREGTISGKIAKTVFADLAAGGGDPERIVKERGLSPITDTAALERTAEELLAAHPGPVSDYLAGKEAAFRFLIGRFMERTGGRAHPQAAAEALERALGRRRTST
jgi:aspartyl-tRNA(Asn)/glutamyl-tRNA(Gln) amidotransferase subunit B